MNNKGFTLVEVLSVIALLALVVIISVPIIGNVSENIKKNTLNTKIKNIEKAAVLYGQEHRESFTDKCNTSEEDLCYGVSGECNCYNNNITVQDLLDEGKIEGDAKDSGNKEIFNPLKDNKKLNDCKIQIYEKYGKIYAVYLEKSKQPVTNEVTMCWYE